MKSLLNLNIGYQALTNEYKTNADQSFVNILRVRNTAYINTIAPFSGSTTSVTGQLAITSTTQSTSTSTGCLTLLGGLGVAKRLNVGEFITAPSIKLTDTSNQITTGAGSNLTTVNFPASSGAVTVTMPNVTSTLCTTDTAQNVTATKTFTTTQNMTTINRTSGDLTLQTTTSGIIQFSSATNMTYTSATTTLASHIFNSSVNPTSEVDMKIVKNSATSTCALQLSRSSTNSTTIASIGSAGSYSSLSVQGDSVIRWENNKTLIMQGFTSNVATFNTTNVKILNSTASSSTSTGALIITGGVGIGGALFGTSANFNSSVTTPTVTNSALTLQGTDNSTSVTINCGSYVGAMVGSNTKFDFNLPINETDTTDASSSTTGSIRTSGGCGIALKLYVGTGIYLPTSSGVASEFNSYQSSQSHSTKFSGPWAVDPDGDVKVTADNKRVTLDFGELLSSATIASSITMNTVLPSKWRPRGNKTFHFPVQDNATNFNGAIVIASSTGAVTIYKDITLTGFTGAGNTGFKGCSVTYETS